MCGLSGFSGKENYNIDKMKFLMLWNSVERGKDATGIFTPQTGVIKDAEPAGKFFYSKDIEALKPDTTIIAHVRAKTSGTNIRKNAHPFQYGNTTLAHNGTLQEPLALGLKFDLKGPEWDVDSQVLAFAINKAFEREGELNFDVISEYQGAAALLFYNSNTERLYAYRDTQRPLFYGWDEVGGMYISSIEDSLKAIGCFAITEFEAKTVYTIHGGQIENQTVYQLYAEKYAAEIAAKELAAKQKNQASKSFRYKYPKKKKDQRGFSSKECEAQSLVGFWLKATNTIIPHAGSTGAFGKMAKVLRNNWYFVSDYYSIRSPFVKVYDEDGQLGQVAMAVLDTENFIPIPGDKVEFLENITSTKTHKKLWSRGDVGSVISASPEKNEVIVFNTTMKHGYIIDTAFIRLIPPTAVELPSSRQLALIVDDNSADNEPPEEAVDTVNNPETEFPFKDPDPQMPASEEEEEVITGSNGDDYVDSGLYHDFVSTISNCIDELEKDYSEEKDLTPNINEIKSKLAMAQDPTFLASYSSIS